MKRIILIIFVLLISGTTFAQRKTRRQIKQESYELKMKQEWDSYLLRVNESKELKAKLKAQNDSLKLVLPKKDSLICDKITVPAYYDKDTFGNNIELVK